MSVMGTTVPAQSGEWAGRWSSDKPRTRFLNKQRDRQRLGFAAIIAWPLLTVLLQATVLNPLFIEGLLKNLGFGDPPVVVDEVVVPEIPGAITEDPPFVTEPPVTATPAPPTVTLPPVTVPPVAPTLPTEIAINLKEGSASQLTFDKLRVLPGETQTVVLSATNTGNVPLSTIFMKAVGSNEIFNDPQNGLTVNVWGCSQEWRGTTTNPVCPGGPVLGNFREPLSNMNGMRNTNVNSGNPGDVKHLLVSFTLADTADNRYKNQETKVTMQVTARRSG